MEKVRATIIGGIIATIALLLAIYGVDATGVFAINPPVFVQNLFGESIWLGWLLHLIAGQIFAFFYAYFFVRVLSWIPRHWLRGAVYGIIIAILIQISMYMTLTDDIEGNMTLEILSMMLIYAIYGGVLGFFLRNKLDV